MTGSPRLVGWAVVGVLVLGLAVGVLVLDRRQTGRGEPSLLGLSWGRARSPAPPASESRRAGGPRRIAVIVDGLGARLDVFEEVVALGRPLSVAVLPGLPLSRRIALDAQRAGLEVLLQLPLEPYRFPELDPGPGALLVSMAPDEVTRRARRQLATLPGVAGVMTHMGSRFTEDRLRMQALLDGVRGEGRFFVDGLASQWSAGYDLARGLGMPAARRQVLLDPEEQEAAVRGGLDRAERWVLAHGAVVAIGHGRLLTVRLLAEALRGWEARGLRLVPVGELVERGKT